MKWNPNIGFNYDILIIYDDDDDVKLSYHSLTKLHICFAYMYILCMYMSLQDAKQMQIMKM